MPFQSLTTISPPNLTFLRGLLVTVHVGVLSTEDLLGDHSSACVGVGPGLDLPGHLAPSTGVAETQHTAVITA